jgi:hypothetical protein
MRPRFRSRPDFLAPGLLVLVILIAVAGIAWLRLRKRPTPQEIERQRRLAIHREGKIGNGQIIDVVTESEATEPETASIVYSYSVAGVVYTASQDVTDLQDKLPADRMSMVGAVSVKFVPRNPANSIVLCEEWTGLRNR